MTPDPDFDAATNAATASVRAWLRSRVLLILAEPPRVAPPPKPKPVAPKLPPPAKREIFPRKPQPATGDGTCRHCKKDTERSAQAVYCFPCTALKRRLETRTRRGDDEARDLLARFDDPLGGGRAGSAEQPPSEGETT